MRPGTHLIRRQTLEFVVTDGEDPRALQEVARRLCDEELLPAMEQVMSRSTPADEWLRIGRLELDLGRIDRREFGPQLLARMQQRLGEALASHWDEAVELQGAVMPDARWDLEMPLRADAARSALAALGHYLETGLTPWWYAGDFDLDEQLLQLLADDQAGLQACLQRLPPDRVAARLARQLPEPTLASLLAMLVQDLGGEWALELADWGRLLRRLPASGQGTASRVFHQALLAYLLPPLPQSASLQQLHLSAVSHALHRLADALSLEQPALVQQLSAEAATRPAADNPVSRLLLTLEQRDGVPARARRSSTGQRRGGVDSTTADRPHGVDHPGTREHRSGGVYEETPRGTGVPKAVPSQPEATAGSASRRMHGPEPAAQAGPESLHAAAASSGVTPDTETAQPASVKDIPELAEGHFLDNAGLVLLWPFLPGFFQQLGLADKQGFLSGQDRERAVLLSAFLVGEQTRFFENDLLLNKLLCGWPLLEPVELALQPTDREMEEVRTLLSSVIGHWQTLGKTSVAGFREAFLKREGRLRHDDLGWQLTVNRNAHDVLLESLPWGLGLISLPWMAEPLRVEW